MQGIRRRELDRAADQEDRQRRPFDPDRRIELEAKGLDLLLRAFAKINANVAFGPEDGGWELEMVVVRLALPATHFA